VVVPNFNYAHYLYGRISSIRKQTHPIQEIIVLDDASTDNSAVVISGMEREAEGPVQAVYNAKNSGSVARQWMRGVELAKGELVWIAEVDDLSDPGFLAATVTAFDDHDVVLSYCQSRRIDEVGNVLQEDYSDYLDDVDRSRWRHDYKRPGIEEIADVLSVRNTIPNISAVVFRRTAIACELNAHHEELSRLRIAADWCCYLHLLRQGSVAYTARVLSSHRSHQHSVTSTIDGRRHMEEILQMQRLAEKLARVPPHRAIAARLWFAACAEMSMPAPGQ
jgi:glycosyltransferase involved in cell wall biosynthesis